MENVKDTKEAKTRVVLINQIIDRAAELGIMYSSRLSHSMEEIGNIQTCLYYALHIKDECYNERINHLCD